MLEPSKEELDKIRRQGFRPNVVGCFLFNKKILFLYSQEYDLWQFPQGGIDNGETIDQAFKREMDEEMGKDFMKTADEKYYFIGEDKINFPIATQYSRELETDDGSLIFMQGKKYFFIAVTVKSEEIKINDTEFNDYKWASYSEGLELAKGIYQKGKAKITINALSKLKSLGYIE